MENLLKDISEALYIGNGDNVILESEGEITDSMQWYIDYGYNIVEAERLGVKYGDLPTTDKEMIFWADYKKILVADKYNSARGYWVLR